MPDLTDPAVLAQLRAQLENPELWKDASMPKRGLPPNLPGEFMKAPAREIPRGGLPPEFGPFATAGTEVITGIKDTVNSAGPAANAALDALKKYLSRY